MHSLRTCLVLLGTLHFTPSWVFSDALTRVCTWNSAPRTMARTGRSPPPICGWMWGWRHFLLFIISLFVYTCDDICKVHFGGWIGYSQVCLTRWKFHSTLPYGTVKPLVVTSDRLVMLLIEKICDKDAFIRKARESFYIQKFNTLKKLPVSEINATLPKLGQLNLWDYVWD